MAKKKKIRAEFRKDHQVRRRQTDLTRQFARDEDAGDAIASSERLSGKGDLTRKRTVIGSRDRRLRRPPRRRQHVAARPRAQRAWPVERRAR
jgi:hypothetical protein